MSKDQAAASLSPTLMILGAPIYAEHLRSTIKQANWTFGNRPQIHLNQSTGKRTGTGSSAAETTPTTIGLEFRGTAAGMIEVLRFYVNILPETVNVICGAEVYISAGGASVRFTIGAATQTITYLTADSGTEKTATITTASSGTGWQICTVEIENTGGVVDMQLSRVRVQDESITSALPSPTIEGDSETMDIQEEGSAVVISARKLNFIGADITAASAGSGTANVTVSGGGAVLPVADTTEIAKGSVDATKKVRLECDTNIATATTRVITIADQDVDLTPNTGTFPGTSRQITAGEGLQGGGDFSADRTVSVDIPGLVENLSPAGSDLLMLYDGDAGLHRKLQIGNLPDASALTIETHTASAVLTGANKQVLADVSTGAAALTFTLPAAATATSGAWFSFKDKAGQAGTYAIHISPDAAETIDGASGLTSLISNNAALTIFTDGSAWYVRG